MATNTTKYILYKCINLISELSINKGDEFIKTSNGYKSIHSGKKLPEYIDVLNSKYFTKSEIELPYQIGDTISYRVKKNKCIGIVTKVEVTHITVHDIQNRNAVFTVPVRNVINKIECYYFITSGGSIQKTYTGRDTYADWWRKQTDNYYLSSDAANEAKKNIQEVFKKS